MRRVRAGTEGDPSARLDIAPWIAKRTRSPAAPVPALSLSKALTAGAVVVRSWFDKLTTRFSGYSLGAGPSKGDETRVVLLPDQPLQRPANSARSSRSTSALSASTRFACTALIPGTGARKMPAAAAISLSAAVSCGQVSWTCKAR